jgi:hypothetical protein
LISPAGRRQFLDEAFPQRRWPWSALIAILRYVWRVAHF